MTNRITPFWNLDTESAQFVADIQYAPLLKAKRLIRKQLSRMGYKFKRNGVSTDRGVDWILERGRSTIAVQLKHHSKQSGAPDVRKMLGSQTELGVDEVWIISRVGFTSDARELAEEHAVKLIELSQLPKLRSLWMRAG